MVATLVMLRLGLCGTPLPARRGGAGHGVGEVRAGTLQLVERVVAIDWSGRVDASGQRRHIYAAVWTAAGAVAGRRGLKETVRLENGRTREEVAGYALSPAIEILWVEDGDHDLRPRKGVTGVSAAEAMTAVSARVRDWAGALA